MKPRRKGATEMIESKEARNVCFSKRRQGLFKKAAELRSLIPNVSVTAIAFSPAGTPFLSDDPSSLVPLTNQKKNEMDTLLGLNIASLNMAELESHKKDLLRLRSFLLSKCMDGSDDPCQQGNEVSIMTTEIEQDGSQCPLSMNTDCDDVPSRNEGSGFTLADSIGIEDNDEEIEALLRDFLNDDDPNCNMDYGPRGFDFSQVQSDGIVDDEEIRVLLNIDFDAWW